MKDLLKMMPHSKTESKLDTKKQLSQLNELAEIVNVNKARKKKDLYLWLSCTPDGPSAKFLVENVHTTAELKLTGNCLRSSRPIVAFDESFEAESGGAHGQLLKELFVQTFGTPNHHPRSQPYTDKLIVFAAFNNRYWFRTYQIAEESGALVEVGPRFSLNLIKIFSGSFCGSVIYSNPHFVSPNMVRRVLLASKKDKYAARVDSKIKTETDKKNRKHTYEVDPLDDLFE